MRTKLAFLFVIAIAAVAPATTHGQTIEDILRNFLPDQPQRQRVQRDEIAHIRIAGNIVETPPAMPMVFFGTEAPLSIKELIERLRQAGQDQAVKAVLLDLGSANLGLAQIQELHAEISKIKAVNKQVFVHAVSINTSTYALATAASHISIVPGGGVNLIGLHVRSPYLKGLLDRIGLEADFVGAGAYKTAPETFTRTGPSDNSKEMTGWILDSLYESIVEMIVTGRGADKVGDTVAVRALIDGGPYSAEDALKAKLIDSVSHHDQFGAILSNHFPTARIIKDYGKQNPLGDIPDTPFGMFQHVMKMMQGQGDPMASRVPMIAVIYIDGQIIDGRAQPSLFGGQTAAYSDTIRKALTLAAVNPAFKAVVLRINSPGGSATASEVIHNATKLVKSNGKPLVVSMGNFAASGGYYVAVDADIIFVSPATLTGSIGVFGGKFVTTGGWGKLGINWSSEQRGKMAGILSSAQPFTEAERAKVTASIDQVYTMFKSRVLAGRGDRLVPPIDELAGGRVFTGTQAIKLGLADRIGGLADAIMFASKRVGLERFEVKVLPRPPTIFDMLSGRAGDGPGISISTSPAVKALLDGAARLDPEGAAAVVRILGVVDIVNEEGVAVIAPELIVR